MTTARHSPPATEIDASSRSLLLRLQSHIPLVTRPFLAVGEEIGLPESEVLDRTRALIDARLIRQIGPIFDGRALGYDSSLVAARYAPGDVEAAGCLISGHPGVSHNYRRDHDFNLWYTLAVPPDQSLTEEAALLHHLSGARSTRLLPSLRMFKLAVKLDMDETPSDGRSGGTTAVSSVSSAHVLTLEEIAAVRAFQEPFEVVARPFAGPAARQGFASADALLRVGEELHRRGAMRRLSAVLRHREAGFSANGMAVWMAPEADCPRLGSIMATFERVSHCYQRPTYEDWPYSLFTMIHGRSEEEVNDCVAAIGKATGLSEYRVLYSSVEFKKARVRYFGGEWAAWRREAEAARGNTDNQDASEGTCHRP